MYYIGDILYDDVLREEELRLIIFGAGWSGRKILEFLDLNECRHKCKYFCDNNKKLWGNEINSVSIISPEEAIRDKHVHFLVGGRFAREMIFFLHQNGVENIHFILL